MRCLLGYLDTQMGVAGCDAANETDRSVLPAGISSCAMCRPEIASLIGPLHLHQQFSPFSLSDHIAIFGKLSPL